MPLQPYEKGNTAGAGGGLAGMLLLKKGSKMHLWQPSYNKGTTLIRPWGDVHSDGTMTPWRDGDGNFGMSFLVQDSVCNGWGRDARLTFFTDVSDSGNWPAGSPASVFFADMRGHAAFKHLMEKPKGTFAPLSAPKAVGFIKGLLLECAGKDYKKNPKWGAVVMLSSSAREAFEELINLAASGSPAGSTDDDPMGWNAKYHVGDPIGFKQGKIFEFDKEVKIQGGTEEDIDLTGDSTAASSNEKAIAKYGCRIWPRKEVLPLEYDKVVKYDETFSEAFNYMTGEEQIHQIIIPGFGRSCREAVLYSFGGKDILPDSFERDQKTFDMGGKAASGGSAVAQTPNKTPDSGDDAGIDLDANNDLDDPGIPWDEEPAADTTAAPSADTVEVGSTAETEVPSTADALRSRMQAAQSKGGNVDG